MKAVKRELSSQKENGRIYTPLWMVRNILDLSGYCGGLIIKKHAIDNSCGDGAFLCEMVARYCEESLRLGHSLDELRSDLEQYIHGIEIEPAEHRKCVDNVNRIANSFGLNDINWDIICDDALSTHKYNGLMDYVLGNPPYIRVHNLGVNFDTIKEFSFAQGGMTDMFIVFYEIGIKMLSEKGILGYISPSSFFNSLAGSYMRKVLVNDNLIDKIVDLKHYQAFSATTYTAIVVLKKGKQDRTVSYFEYDGEKHTPYFIDSLFSDDYYIDGNYYFAKREQLNTLKKIANNCGYTDILVKNGYATLCDSVFINDFKFDSKYIIPAIKASKGVFQKIFFPYDSNGRLIPEEIIQEDKTMYGYLLARKEILTERSHEKTDDKYWYSYGRSQAIHDTFKDKLSINVLIRDQSDLKIIQASSGVGVYSGLYITSDSIPFEDIITALKSDEFVSYVSLLGKYKSGGYYTFSSKDLKAYLDYKFNYDGGIFEC